MIRSASRLILAAAAALGLSACATAPLGTVSQSERSAIEARLMQDISRLASDEFGGRKPGTEGERLTTSHIIAELQAAGFQSGTNNPGSEWLAPFELFSSQPSISRIEFKSGRRTVQFDIDSGSAVAFTSGRRNLVEQGAVVFVGTQGDQVAEESVAGKVVIMIGEPGVSPAKRAALFEKDPAAVLTVVENAVELVNIRRAFDREQINLAGEGTAQLSGYVTQAAIADKVGQKTWSKLLEQAETDGFEPQMLDFKATVEATSQRREFTSNNVIGKLQGTQPGSGAVLLLGHWDHLGECGQEGDADRICNGAVDNASGIAVILELARRLKASGPHERDIYILATSAEESGLLGAQAFVENPSIPLDTIVAAFNFDSVALAASGSKLGFIGEGRTPLDAVVKQVVSESGRELGDKDFANSLLQRQDAWALLQKGVPAVMISSSFSSQIVVGPYFSTNYHRASDEIEIVELGAAIDDLLLHEELVRRIANTALYPGPEREGGG